MTIRLLPEYLIGLAGLGVGLGVGAAVGEFRRRTLTALDARVCIPLLLAAGGAHLALIGAVEPLRQVLFGLYGLALIGVVVFAVAGWSVWRLGGVVFPLGSIGAYFYFATLAHQADYVGLLIKLVEAAAVVAIVVPSLRTDRRRPRVLSA